MFELDFSLRLGAWGKGLGDCRDEAVRVKGIDKEYLLLQTKYLLDSSEQTPIG